MRKLSVGVGKSEKMAVSGRRSPVKGRPVLKPRGAERSKRDVRTLDAHPKNQNYVQGIVHGGSARGHTAVLDIGAQQSIVGIGSWEIIKQHYTWIDT